MQPSDISALVLGAAARASARVPDALENRKNFRMRDGRRRGGLYRARIEVPHDVAETRAQCAAERGCGAGSLRRRLRGVAEPLPPRRDVCDVLRPVHFDGLQGGHIVDEPLIAQVPENQPLGGGTERHQGDEFAPIDGDRQRPLNGQVR